MPPRAAAPSAPVRPSRRPLGRTVSAAAPTTTTMDGLTEALANTRLAPPTADGSPKAAKTATLGMRRTLSASTSKLPAGGPSASAAAGGGAGKENASATRPAAPTASHKPVPAAPAVDDPTRASRAMAIVNASLQALSAAAKAAKQTSSDAPSSSAGPSTSTSASSKALETQISKATGALADLRALVAGKKIGNRAGELEKSSLGMVAHALDLGLNESALSVMHSVHRSVHSFYQFLPSASATTQTQASSSQSHTRLLHLAPPSMPLPEALKFAQRPAPPAMDVILLALALQQYALGSLLRSKEPPRAKALLDALSVNGGPHTWRKMLDDIAAGEPVDEERQGASVKKADAMITSIFGSVMRFCATLDDAPPTAGGATTALALRTWALHAFLLTRALGDGSKADAFYDQVRKAIVFFARAAEREKMNAAEASAHVKTSFLGLFRALPSGDADQGSKRTGKQWTAMCEVVLHLAKRGEDLVMMEFLAGIMDSSAKGAGEKDKEGRISAIVARLERAGALLDAARKGSSPSSDDVRAQAQWAAETLPVLGEMYATLERGTKEKIDKSVERLRWSACAAAKGKGRPEELMSSKSKEKETDGVEGALAELLSAYLGFMEQTTPVATRTDKRYMRGLVEAVQIVAYRLMVPDDWTTHSSALEVLERAAAVLQPSDLPFGDESDDDDDSASSSADLQPMRALTSVYYNIGGTLYNISQPAAALPFAARACTLSEQALATQEFESKLLAELAAASGANEDVDELKKHLPRRYELLGLANQAVGDNKAAFEAFVAAVGASPPDELAAIEADVNFLSRTLEGKQSVLIRTAQRATKLGCIDLLYSAERLSLAPVHAGCSSPAVVGALVELQTVALEQLSHKPEVAAACLALQDVLIDLYSPSEHPVQRARAIVRKMEYCCSSAGAAEVDMPALAREVDHLCAYDAINVGTTPSSSQARSAILRALAHMFVAFGMHRSDPNRAVASISVEALAALQLLQECLSDGPPVAAAEVEVATVNAPRKSRAPPPASKGPFKTPKPTRKLLPSQSNPSVIKVSPRAARKATAGRLPALDEDIGQKLGSYLGMMASVLDMLGLTTVRVAYLQFQRRLFSTSDLEYLTASAELGYAYLKLGKVLQSARAFAQAESRANDTLPANATVLLALYTAEQLAAVGSHDKSAAQYQEALELNEKIDDDDGSSASHARLFQRVSLIRRASVAANVWSSMLQAKGECTSALASALQAWRLTSRALSIVCRFAGKEASTSKASAFASRERPDPNAPLPSLPDKDGAMDVAGVGARYSGLAWVLGTDLIHHNLQIARLHLLRGNPKTADYFSQQAEELALQLGSSHLATQARVLKIETKMGLQHFELADGLLKEALDSLDDASSPERIALYRLAADSCQRQGRLDEADRWLSKTHDMITLVQSDFNTLEPEPSASPAKSNLLAANSSVVQSASPGRRQPAPDVAFGQLQAQAAITQIVLTLGRKRPNEVGAVLRRVAQTVATEADKASELKMTIIVELHDLLERLRADPVLGVVEDASLSVPLLGTISSSSASISQRTGIVNGLREIDGHIRRLLAQGTSRLSPRDLREVTLNAVVVKVLQSSLGKASKTSSSSVAHFLDTGLATTIRREMLDAIDVKLSTKARDDLVWPRVEVQRVEPTSAASALWTSVRERYRSDMPDNSLTDATLSSQLPPRWLAISLHLSADSQHILLARHQHGRDPLVFKLSLNRFADGDEDEEVFTFAAANEELREIIARSNLGSQSAKNVEGKEARVAWWAERRELDMRLKAVTESIETEWLGVFKSAMLHAPQVAPQALTMFKNRIERILKRCVTRHQDAKAPRFKLDDNVVTCLSALPPTCRDEDLEDLFHFMIHSYQSAGMPIASDETDIDQIVCDLRSALEELHNQASTTPSASDDEHVVLVLDKNLQGFPWECIPSLKGKSISRLPSLAFLRDRLDMLTARQAARWEVDSSRTAYLLNPSTDLRSTQQTFEPWVEDMRKTRGWTGIVGRVPSEEEVRSKLATQDLMLYFGHGGAEQYIRSQTVRNLEQCAVTMLWGCSSGYLKDQGDFDPIGTAYHYMIAGCPALVANLWDVTDKDIDALAGSVFKHIGLMAPSDDAPAATPPMSLTKAIADSRTVCTLQYLNGAAPVVYGLPVWFS